ncbi:hypothetical protein [Methyloferula stellata]|uniref:hypothetical protein n=1 Tax=Methyloferula stellata TaxID=876270 RepID=UPI00037DB1B4|nr:hypothetical protein [Methyloferula stellata]
MLPLAGHKIARLAALLLYVLASTTLGFAHRFDRLATPSDLAQFALPDGTLPIICGKGRSSGHDESGGHASFCGACCLTSAPGLLFAPLAVFSAQATSEKFDWQPYRAAGQLPRFFATLGARGPPSA